MPPAASHQDAPMADPWRRVRKPGDPCILLIPGHMRRDKPARLRGRVEETADSPVGVRVLVRLESGLRCWAGIDAVVPRDDNSP